MAIKLTIMLPAKILTRQHRPINDIMTFRQKARIHFQRKGFTVKTVQTRRELLQSFRLRYDVFHKEYIGKTFPIGFDTDRYDRFADHLVIIDDKIGRVVGTYRLIASCFSQDFYSSSEFDLGEFLASPGIKLELSRACIHKNYRQGHIISYLWRGISEYMQEIGAKYLFGCSSVKTMELDRICEAFHQMDQKGAINRNFNIQVRDGYRIDNFEMLAKEYLSRPERVSIEIPTLLSAYLKAGAKVLPNPAVDKEFNCTDFLTILDLTRLSDTHAKKYLRK